MDVEQIDVARVVHLQLGGRMPLDRERQFVRPHAPAVVHDQDARQAARVGLDLDPARARIDGVLDEFLDGAGGPFDHLAGGDAVHDLAGEAADGHESDVSASRSRGLVSSP